MKPLKFASLIALALLSAHTAFAQVTFKDPWVRASVPRQKSTGAFMQLTATQYKRLVEARSPVANAVEIHEMAMEGDVMKMRAGSRDRSARRQGRRDQARRRLSRHADRPETAAQGRRHRAHHIGC